MRSHAVRLVLPLLLLLCSFAAARAELIGYWNFDTATLGTDASGKNNTLSIGGSGVTASTIAGKIGAGCLRVRGAGYLSPAASVTGLPVGNTPYTVTAWIRPSATGARGIVGWGNFGTTRQVNALRLDGTSGFSHYWWAADLLVGNAGVAVNTWMHVATSYDGATRSIYVNGSLLTSDVPGVNGAVNSNFAIGRTNGSEYFSGYLDEVAIWTTALPASQINSLAKGTITPLTGPQVTSFAANKTSGLEGETAQLTWTVNTARDTGALSVAVTQGATTFYTGTAASSSCTVTLPGVNGTAQAVPFTITATDAGSAVSATATVSINTNPNRPTANPQSGLSVLAPNTLPITLSGADAGNAALTYAVAVPPAHGTLSGAGAARTYTPAAGYSGPDSFTFKVNNGFSDSATALVSLQVLAAPSTPTAIALSSQTVTPVMASGAFVGNFSTVDANPGVPHAYSLVSGAGSADNARFTISGHQLRAAQSFSDLTIGGSLQIRVRTTNASNQAAEAAFVLTITGPTTGKVVINEILYNGQDNTVPDDFVELYNSTGAAVDVSGWRLADGIDYTIPNGTTMAAGGYLVIAGTPATVLSKFGVQALGPFIGGLSSAGEKLTLRDAASNVVCQVDYTPRFPWPVPANGEGASMELINPNLDPSLGGSWRSSIYPALTSASDIATPGARNAQYSASAAPAIRQTAATPAQPAENAPVTITARVTDPDGVGSVQLQYQLVAPGSYLPAILPNSVANHAIANTDAPPPANPAFELASNWITVPMNDDGVNGDSQDGDGIYTATLPGQANRTLVRYRIVAADNLGNAVRGPGVDDLSRNFAYFVYNGVPDYQGTPAATLTKLPVYHFLTRVNDYNDCVAYDITKQLVSNTASWSYENWEAAIVYDGTVYDHVLYRLHGANGRYYFTGKRAFRWFFNKGYEFQGKDNDGNAYPEPWRHVVTENLWENRGTQTYSLNEAVNFYLFGLIGVPAPSANWCLFRLVDNVAEQPDAWHGDFWGLMFVHEDYEKNFLDAHNLPKGNLYKLTKDGVSGLSQQRYQAANAVSTGADHDNIYSNLKGTSTPDFVTSYVNIDRYDYYHALAEGIRHYDYWPNGDNNGAYYFAPNYTAANSNYGQLWILPSDTDATWGPTWNNGHDIVHNALFNDSGDSGGDTGTNPTLWPQYFNAIREVRDLLWQTDQINPLIDQFAAVIAPLEAADAARWKGAPADVGNYNSLAGAGATSLANLAQDMKNFAFVGGTWPGGNVDAGGRAAYLDTLQLGVANSEGSQIPATPTIAYIGSSSTHPVNDLRFQTGAYSDPQGAGTFSAMQWRMAEITDPAAPAYVAGSKLILEWTATYNTGEVTTFANQFRYPATACRPGHTYRARVRFKDNTGRWSHWSTPSQFTAAAADVSGYQSSLVISEFMYHPIGPTAAESQLGYIEDDFEYIEVRNVSATPVDMTDVRMTKGINFDFPAGMILAPGASTLIVRNPAAFASRYGAGRPIAGTWRAGDSLKNSGEEVKLSYGAGQSIIDFTYTDKAPWPKAADSSGYSVVLIAPETLPDPAQPANWRASWTIGGNPGGDDGLTFSQWAAAHPGAGTAGDDTDGDGINNMLEYAMGSDPLVSNVGALPQVQMQALSVDGVTDNYLTIVFTSQLESHDVSYHAEFSPDMSAWSESGVFVSAARNANGTVTQMWRAAAPVGSAGAAGYARLRVVLP